MYLLVGAAAAFAGAATALLEVRRLVFLGGRVCGAVRPRVGAEGTPK